MHPYIYFRLRHRMHHCTLHGHVHTGTAVALSHTVQPNTNSAIIDFRLMGSCTTLHKQTVPSRADIISHSTADAKAKFKYSICWFFLCSVHCTVVCKQATEDRHTLDLIWKFIYLSFHVLRKAYARWKCNNKIETNQRTVECCSNSFKLNSLSNRNSINRLNAQAP